MNIKGWLMVLIVAMAGAAVLSVMPEPQGDFRERLAAAQPQPLIDTPPVYPDSIRNVTPDDVLPHPRVTGPLKRVAGVRPPPPEEVKRDDTLDFQRPLVLDARSMRVKKTTIRLAHLAGPTLAEKCPSRLGGDWPCGMRARTALRGLIRNYAIHCDEQLRLGENEILASCTKGPTDLSRWMLEQGWARPTQVAPKDLKNLSLAAQDDRRGLWQLDGSFSWSGPTLSTQVQEPDIPLDDIEILPAENLDASTATPSGADATGDILWSERP
ncbi:hypothetical protein GR183_13665 [Stappia sp. GBMRC 2046]|uniref:Endonuclease YncB, thermonuclease family n=1 Tax=Stappia sediminis TaxID=2692190 RepID=A0A7X3S8K8_9HYPH|nr:thermonuclease family protein [Stappia sediminis]MXN65956.1 hypothetical protein [Stappia sediminis]